MKNLGRFKFIICLMVLLIPYICFGKNEKILFVIAYTNFRDEEFLKPQKILKDNGYEIEVCSWKKGTAKGMLGEKVSVNLTLEEVKPEDYAGIIFVGGTGSMNFFDDKNAIFLARDFCNKKKPVGAICLAPVILARAGILKGKKVTCYDNKEEFEKVEAIYTGKDVEVDGNIVTGNGPEAAEKFGKTFLKLLK